jgi:hypothetical protein
MPNQKSSKSKQPHEKRAPKQDPQGKRQSDIQQSDQKMNNTASRRESFDVDESSHTPSGKNKRR